MIVFPSITTWHISTKLDRIVPWEVLYQNCSNRYDPLHELEARAKNRKILYDISAITTLTKLDRIAYKNCTNRSTLTHKLVAWATDKKKTSNNISSVTPWPISTNLEKIVPWEVLYQNCSNCWAPLHKMAARTKNNKKKTSNNISSISTWRISTKIDRIVPWEILHMYQNYSNCSTWLHEEAARVKIDKKSFKQHLRTNERISTKLDRIVLWEVLFQNCSNRSALLKKMATNGWISAIVLHPPCCVHHAALTICFKSLLLLHHWASWLETW